MEILSYTIIYFTLAGLVTLLLLRNNPYVKAKKLVDTALERIEILKHKWLESEKVGHDIGIKSAKKSWKRNHAKEWRKSRKNPSN
tara:strand:+ start:997 stop:1251 length:255 start_codon:yes stop_codon:yes gene_type:complete